MPISWLEGIRLETESAIILKEQEERGVYFDRDLAFKLIDDLEDKKSEQEAIIRPFLTYQISPLETKKGDELNYVKKIYLKSGDYTESVLRHYPEDPSVVEAPFSRILIEEPSISQRMVIVEQLLKLGWKPTVFTEPSVTFPQGQPKLTDKGEPVESLFKVGPFGNALASYYTCAHRQSQIKGFLPHIREDGRIPAGGMVVGTNTFRFTHKIVANIPRVTSFYGKEMRSLFSSEEGKVLVGCDLSGIEARLLAHYMRDAEYIDLILNGDIHEYNRVKAGLDTRDQAKTFFYGFLKQH